MRRMPRSFGVAIALQILAAASYAQAMRAEWTVYTDTNFPPVQDTVQLLLKQAGDQAAADFTIKAGSRLTPDKMCGILKYQQAGLFVTTLSSLARCFDSTTALQGMDFPYLAHDWREAREILAGPIGAVIADGLRANSIDLLTFWQGEPRVFASTMRLAGAADFKGRKVLAPQSFSSQVAIGTLGGTHVTRSFAETQEALVMGLAETVDTTLGGSVGLSRDVKAAIVTNHLLDPYLVLSPSKYVGELSAPQQARLETLLRRATRFEIGRAQALEADQLRNLRAAGVTITLLTESQRTGFKNEALRSASAARARQVFASVEPRGQAAAIQTARGNTQATYVPVLFATNRTRDPGGTFTNEGDSSVLYGKADVELTYDEPLPLPLRAFKAVGAFFSSPGRAVRVDAGSVSPTPPPASFASAPPSVPTSAPLVYVHGFANTFDEALKRGAWLSWNAKRPVLVFSWPSQGRPTPNDYRSDQSAADASSLALAEVLRDLRDDVSDGTQVDVVAHSMGSRVLLAALQELRRSDSDKHVPRLRQIVLVAPDVASAALDTQWRGLHSLFDRKATLYVSDHDLALGISRQFMNPDDGPRAGLAPPILVCADVESIFIGPNEFSLTGHSYHVANGVIADDLMETLRYGVEASKRRGTLSPSNGAGYFEIRRLDGL